jgi:hypothetical protein
MLYCIQIRRYNMTIADWKKKNAGNFTENETSTHITLRNPSMQDLRDIIDNNDWDLDLMEYLYLVVVNDNTADFSWVYLVSDSGIDMELKPSKKHPDRLIAWSEAYSDKWELVEFIEIDYNRETEVNTFLVKVPSENEPIELYMS